MRILLIEDDEIIGDGIKKALSRRGFCVDWFKEGVTGKQALTLADYEAVALDLSLPGMDGLEVLRAWRKSGNSTPVLILTARGALEQRVEGLNLGADDYLGKPFALEELIARLHALVRRRHGQTSALLSHGSVSFNPQTRTLLAGKKTVPLSPKTTQLVELFLLNKQKVLSKTAIEEKLYSWGEEVCSNAVEVHIHHIRRKLGKAFIKTVHGIGYTLGEPT